MDRSNGASINLVLVSWGWFWTSVTMTAINKYLLEGGTEGQGKE